MTNLGLALMLENLGISQYSNFDFNSMCRFGDKFLAASDEGLFILGGNKDDGVDVQAHVEFRTTDLGTQSRLRSVYVGYETAGELELSVTDDEANERTYTLSRVQPGQVQQSGRVVVGRDGLGRYWRLKLRNVDGVDFSVDHVELIPVLLARPPRR